MLRVKPPRGVLKRTLEQIAPGRGGSDQPGGRVHLRHVVEPWPTARSGAKKSNWQALVVSLSVRVAGIRPVPPAEDLEPQLRGVGERDVQVAVREHDDVADHGSLAQPSSPLALLARDVGSSRPPRSTWSIARTDHRPRRPAVGHGQASRALLNQTLPCGLGAIRWL
jgi:hypothetical protein